MELDFDTCYRAIRSRDIRFDGRFFTAVTSTGIYCRPVCPAQTPQARHVHFYPSAAAAEAAGFRACRRCRPDAVPGSPDWNVRADLTGRALRLIAEGMVDELGVDGLAHRLAVSPRHLHRELVAAVGAGPLALARTRRCQTARLLIDNTTLPLGEIALAAGFGSIRQFNDAMHAAFGCKPSELRRGEPVPDGSGRITLRLKARLPWEAEPVLRFLAGRAIAGVEEVTDNRYRRTLPTGILELEPGDKFLILRLHPDSLRSLGTTVALARRIFDLDTDPAAVAEVLAADPLLAPLIAARPGLRVPGCADPWEMAVRAILGQQISVAAARTLAGRIAALGVPLAEPHRTLTHRFPRPDVLADADLTGIGLTQRRIATLHALAGAVAGGRIVLDGGADREETRARLLALPGIGPWTASYIQLRALADPDAWPGGDLGLVQAGARLGLSPRELDKRAERWRPWRAYAAIHLWESNR